MTDELPEHERLLLEVADNEELVMRVVDGERVVGTSTAIDTIERIAVNEQKRMLRDTMDQVPEDEFLRWLKRYLWRNDD